MCKKCLIFNFILLYIYLVQKSKCSEKMHMTDLAPSPSPSTLPPLPLRVIVFLGIRIFRKTFYRKNENQKLGFWLLLSLAALCIFHCSTKQWIIQTLCLSVIPGFPFCFILTVSFTSSRPYQKRINFILPYLFHASPLVQFSPGKWWFL